ncbi:unnamed protein product, partial [Polarella glacialis]
VASRKAASSAVAAMFGAAASRVADSSRDAARDMATAKAAAPAMGYDMHHSAPSENAKKWHPDPSNPQMKAPHKLWLPEPTVQDEKSDPYGQPAPREQSRRPSPVRRDSPRRNRKRGGNFDDEAGGSAGGGFGMVAAPSRIERLQVQFLKSLAHLQSCQALQEQHRRRREEEALALEDKDQTPAEPKGKPGFMSYLSVARQECKVQDGKHLEDRREEAEDDTIFLEDALCFLEQQSENMFKREEWLSRRQETCQPRFLASALHVPLSCLSVQRLWCSAGPLGSALIPSCGAPSSQPQPFILQKKCAGACTAAQSVPTPMSCAVGARVSFCLVCDQYMPAGLETLMP